MSGLLGQYGECSGFSFSWRLRRVLYLLTIEILLPVMNESSALTIATFFPESSCFATSLATLPTTQSLASITTKSSKLACSMKIRLLSLDSSPLRSRQASSQCTASFSDLTSPCRSTPSRLCLSCATSPRHLAPCQVLLCCHHPLSTCLSYIG